jgi:hypothetical protein
MLALRILAVCSLALILALAACSALQPVADRAGRAIKQYCEQTSYEARLALRNQINAAAAPHAISIACAHDPTE